jgi:Tfp pilus assembly protein PilF
MELLALVYLNADQPDIAEKYYQQLVSSNKENSLWWLGLAISQDASGKYMNASESFNQAKQVGRFNTEILDYINNKIKEINKY